MRRVRNKITIFVKNSTREIVAFFDVHRIGRVGQRGPHLIRDGHKQVVEHFQHHRIDLGSNGLLAGQGAVAVQDKATACDTFSLPPVFKDIRAGGFCEDRGPLHHIPFAHLRTVNHRRVMLYISRPHLRGSCGCCRAVVRVQLHRFTGLSNRFGGKDFDDQVCTLWNEPKALFMRRLKGFGHIRLASKRNLEGLLRASRTDMCHRYYADIAIGYALASDFGHCVLTKSVQYTARSPYPRDPLAKLVFAHCPHIGKPHAERG
jgi:hypothetical protein